MISGIMSIAFGIYSLFGKSMAHFNVKSSFLFGSIVSMTWSGCIGPMLGIILVMAADSASSVAGGFLLLLYSLGLLFPLIVLSLYAEKIPKKIWDSMKGKLIKVEFFGKEMYFHTTNIFSAALFVTFGVFLIFNISNRLTYALNGFSEFVFDIQYWIIQFFNVR
jgi:cytochrome c-type biogenesis protein